MSMKPDRGILCTYRRSDVLSTIPDNLNPSLASLSIQMTPPGTLFTALLHVILPRHIPTLRYIYIYIYVYVYSPDISFVVTITASTAPLRQEPSHCQIRYPTIARSYKSAVPCWQPFQLDSTHLFFDLSRLNCAFYLIRLNLFIFNSIQLTSNIFIFNLIHTIRITFQSGFRESHIAQGVSEIFQH